MNGKTWSEYTNEQQAAHELHLPGMYLTCSIFFLLRLDAAGKAHVLFQTPTLRAAGHPGSLWVLPGSCVLPGILARGEPSMQGRWPDLHRCIPFPPGKSNEKEMAEQLRFGYVSKWMALARVPISPVKMGALHSLVSPRGWGGGVIFILHVANKCQNTSQPFECCSLLITRNCELQLME